MAMMLEPPEPNIFKIYDFNPYQFSLTEKLMLDFHRRHVAYFIGCSKVLDLGAGRGFFLRELKKKGIVGLGVENDLESIAAGEKFGIQYIKTDIFEFLRSNECRKIAGQCDGVYCCHVIEHLEPAEVFELFRRVKENCAPNLRCRFITNNPADIDVLGYNFWMDLTHRRLYPSELLVAMAKSQGFTIATARPFRGKRLSLFGQIKWLLRRLRWGRHKGKLNLLLDCS